MRNKRVLYPVILAVLAVGSAIMIAQARAPLGESLLGGFVAGSLGETEVAAEALPVHNAAAERVVPNSQAQLLYSYSELVKKTAGAVVNVYAERMVSRSSPFGGDPFFERFFGQRMPHRSQKQSSLGSGVIIDSSGLIVTNNHVIDGADEIKVALSDGREYSSKVLLKDKRVDIAVLQIEDDADFVAIGYSDSDRLEVGDIVLAIGNPFGVGQTVTSGIVSALARNGIGISDFGFFIQTDAAINPGNSGGALIDMHGNLIGINTAIFSRSGGSNGIGFAIPANMVKAVVDAAKRGDERFKRPYIGATFAAVTGDMAEALGMKRASGAIVTDVAENGPADKGGLTVGDLVISMNGVVVEHPDALGYRLATAGVGRDAEFEVMSRSKIRKITITLEAPWSRGKGAETVISGNNPFAGATVADLVPKLAEDLNMPTGQEGVVVLAVESGSPAVRFGLKERDIVTVVNGKSVTSVNQMVEMVSRRQPYWRFEINRNGKRFSQLIR